MTKSKVIIPQEVAEQELTELLNSMGVDTDTESMLEDDAKGFKDKLRSLALPVAQGRAFLECDSYVLTLKKPLDKEGLEKTITIREPEGLAWEIMDRGGKNQDMKKLLLFISGMVGIPYAQVRSLPNTDLKVLKDFALLFMV